MKLSALRFADFSSLGEAATNWSEMVTKLKSLSDDANDQLKGKADKANWAGTNATVTRDFITKTSSEFKDAHSQAQSIYNILNDAKTELEGYKKSLNERIDRGIREHNLTVTDNGDSFTVTMNVHPDRSSNPSSLPENSQADVDALRDDIQTILTNATTSDTTAADALKAIVNAQAYGFANVSYADRDSAATALREAEKMAALAKDPKDLSKEEFDELNAGLAKYHNDDLFSERFATQLGAEGTLKFWATINDPRDGGELGQDRVDKYGELQTNLSLTLANATQSDSPAMRTWERDMVAMGDKTIETGTAQTRGFPIMSSLMRSGDFDDKFLTDYGNKLMETERKITNSTDMADIAWHDPMGLYLNRTGSDTGADPMTGYMKALGNSPDAATDFFNADYGDLKSDEDEKNLTNFDYLFEEREWVPDTNSDMDESDEGRNAMAHALEAATTGHPAGESPKLENLEHNQGQADLYSRLVGSVSEDRDRLLDHRSMADSFGRMSAEYMPDIHRALDPTQQNEAGLYPISGATAEMTQGDVTRFLHTVGRSPEGYAAINIGEHNYTAALMQHHFQNPDSYINDPNFSQADNLDATIGKVSERAGEIQGIIGAGRAFEAEADGGAKDAEFNGALDSAKNWGSGLVGVGVGVATAPFTGPGGIVAGGIATTGADAILDAIFGGMEKDSAGEIIYRNGEEWGKTEDSTYTLVERSAQNASEASGNPSPHIVSTASGSAESGFNNAATDVSKYVDGEGIPGELDTED
ncbi:DUF6571 family protein [Streptomyces albidus (ex Kaewkla and Franco 2022)]|uniref:DUF6571 family protein n=1 Tax=Streptomyces albidus (ex Kaewkla and Franco 2022) TaxID=722709 RepID=UPI0015EEA48D|nr:DUF6571 family protein [Streptomyces albidus (ex Kaewkla and Franco 2022)]